MKKWNKELATELYEKGWSDEEIAEACAVKPSTIASWRREQNLTSNHQGETPPTLPSQDGGPEPAPDNPACVRIRIETDIGEVSLTAANAEAALSMAEGLVSVARGKYLLDFEIGK